MPSGVGVRVPPWAPKFESPLMKISGLFQFHFEFHSQRIQFCKYKQEIHRLCTFCSYCRRLSGNRHHNAKFPAKYFPKASQIPYNYAFRCPRGGIGRRAWFRSMCLRVWGFESLRGHHSINLKSR